MKNEKYCGTCKHFKYNPWQDEELGNGCYRCELFGSIGNDMKPVTCENWEEK